ncbi:polyprenyl diphosphate synthase [Micromonospora tarensis]|uniref:Isoprenyl transferase n=1 Tax=Micromonospora tarensis TaxID=2806100 RepID=A0ABS1YMB3_9ACTN|nr:polyprenyl diphosphate synthase [Micromonospora tarensis]MBM0278457.1 di-trans,poly-cis-decaprenylcistransferase [Micromonospora tarensis]
MSPKKSDEGAGLHVAIIMDGNRRWAKSRMLPSHKGHEQVSHSIAQCIRAAPDLGVRWLTLYAFSTENWTRPAAEVRYLMVPDQWLLRPQLVADCMSSQVSVRFIGSRDDARIPSPCREWMEEVEARTKTADPRLTVTLAFNYGGRAEILDGVRRALAGGPVGEGVEFVSTLWSGELPDVDLLVRTSGEQRLSNFMLWRCAYSELLFTPTLWPDFGSDDLAAAVAEYRHRSRTFGGGV